MEVGPDVNESPNINSVLKPLKARIPLKEILSNHEDENTVTRKRRVSFANVNKIKEFSSGAESLVVCHTPAYEEPFSISSDSSYPGASSCTAAKQASTVNLYDSMSLCSTIHQSTLRSSLIPSEIEFNPASNNFNCTESYLQGRLNLTDGSTDGSHTLYLTEGGSSRISFGRTYSNKFGRTYSNKTLQVSADFTRYSECGMDLNKSVASYRSSKNHTSPIDHTQFSDSEMDLTKPLIVNSISKPLEIPYDGTRYSINVMELTNTMVSDDLSPEPMSNNISKVAEVADDFGKYDCSDLEFTEVASTSKREDIYSTNDMEFTKGIAKNNLTIYSSNMDCTDIIDTEEYSMISETTMDLTKPIYNPAYHFINDKTDTEQITNIIARTDFKKSVPSKVSSTTSESTECGDSINNDISNDAKTVHANNEHPENSNLTITQEDKNNRHINVIQPPIIDIETSCKNSLDFFNTSSNCKSQSFKSDEIKEFNDRDVTFHTIVSIADKFGESLNCSGNEHNKLITEGCSSETKNVGSVTLSEHFEFNLSKSEGGDFVMESSTYTDGDKNEMNILKNGTENVSHSVNNEHNHSTEKNIIFKNSVFNHNNITTESLSRQLNITNENSTKDSETLTIEKDTSIQKSCLENRTLFNSNNSFNNVSVKAMDRSEQAKPDKTINNYVSLQIRSSSQCGSTSNNQLPLESVSTVSYHKTQQSETKLTLNENILKTAEKFQMSNIGNLDCNKSISDALSKTNDLTTHEDNVLCSTFVTGYNKGGSSDIEDTSILESIPLLQRIKSNEHKFTIKEDFSKCVDISSGTLEDGHEATKGGKRSFDAALEPENDTEESPIKLMCFTKCEQIPEDQLITNVTASSFLADTVHTEATNERSEYQKKDCTIIIDKYFVDNKDTYEDEVCNMRSLNLSLNMLKDDEHLKSHHIGLLSSGRDLLDSYISETREIVETKVIPSPMKTCGAEIKAMPCTIGTFCASENIIELDEGLYICSLIPKWITFQFGLNSNGFITKTCFKIICSEKEKSIGEYLLNQLKLSALPDHITELIQQLKEPRDKYLCELAKSLSVICKYHNGHLENNMLTIEVISCKRQFWLYVSINIKYPQMLSATDITIENKIGDIKLSSIRQIFVSEQQNQGNLLNFTDAILKLQYK